MGVGGTKSPGDFQSLTLLTCPRQLAWPDKFFLTVTVRFGSGHTFRTKYIRIQARVHPRPYMYVYMYTCTCTCIYVQPWRGIYGDLHICFSIMNSMHGQLLTTQKLLRVHRLQAGSRLLKWTYLPFLLRRLATESMTQLVAMWYSRCKIKKPKKKKKTEGWGGEKERKTKWKNTGWNFERIFSSLEFCVLQSAFWFPAPPHPTPSQCSKRICIVDFTGGILPRVNVNCYRQTSVEAARFDAICSNAGRTVLFCQRGRFRWISTTCFVHR